MKSLLNGLCKNCYQFIIHDGMCPYNMENALDKDKSEALFYEDVETCENFDFDGGVLNN